MIYFSWRFRSFQCYLWLYSQSGYVVFFFSLFFGGGCLLLQKKCPCEKKIGKLLILSRVYLMHAVEGKTRKMWYWKIDLECMVTFYKGILNKTYLYILINSLVWWEICSFLTISFPLIFTLKSAFVWNISTAVSCLPGNAVSIYAAFSVCVWLCSFEHKISCVSTVLVGLFWLYCWCITQFKFWWYEAC